MRLDLYTATSTDSLPQANSVQGARQAAPINHVSSATSSHTAATVSVASHLEDTTTLTSGTDSVRSLTETALQVSPTRAQRVADLKQAVSTATYQLDAARIAESLANSVV